MTVRESGVKHPRAWWSRYRLLLYVVLGLAAIDVVIARFANVWRSYEPHPYRDHVRAVRNQRWDLVVVGGSPASYGFDPAMLSGLRWQGHSLERVYNLGLVLGTTAEVYHATKNILSRPPTLLLYGITASDLNDDRVEPNGPRHLMEMSDVVCWCWERPDAIDWCLRHYLDEHVQRLWQLYYYRNGIQRWAAEQTGRWWSGQAAKDSLTALVHLNVNSGDRLDHLRAAGLVKDFFPFLDYYRIDAYLRYLHRLLDWCQERGTEVVLVDLPVPADLEERLCVKQFATYRATLAQVEKSRGVRVLRASRAAVGLTDAHFADLVHLNGIGKHRLSAWVRQALSDGSPTGTHPIVLESSDGPMDAPTE
jgi:hypothetical protein